MLQKTVTLFCMIVGGVFVLNCGHVYSEEEGGIDVNLPIFVDVDGDGFNDIIGIYDTNVRVYINDGMGNFIDSGQRLGLTAVSCFHVTQLFTTGPIHILIGENAQTTIYQNDGAGHFTYVDEISYTFNTSIIAAADIDDDGDKDLAFGHDSGVIIYENTGSLTFTATSSVFTITNPVTLNFNDLDTDEDVDLAIVNDQAVTCFYFNDGSGNFN